MQTIHIDSKDELDKVARALLEALGDRSVIALFGPMGAGKTTLIRELAAQLGSDDTVTSPTFALVNQYSADDGQKIFHFDFYRIDKPEEAFDLGYEEYFYSGNLCLVEWPEKIEALLPDNAMRVGIAIDSENERTFTIE